MRTSLGLALVLALFVTVSGSWAGVIPVTNPSFESPSCPTGTCIPTGWTVAHGGSWTPTSGVFTSIPDGTQVAFGNVGGLLTQVLTTALASDTTYTLTVDVGARAGDGFAPTIQLLAGSTVLGSASGATPTAGNWAVWTLVYDSGSSNPLAGQALEISLASSVTQTSFDAVSLTSTADSTVPEPAVFALVGVGLLGMVTRRRFVK